jgi:hypothetical protein
MRRRDVLVWSAALVLVPSAGRSAGKGTAMPFDEEKWRAESIAKFPFERVVTTGDKAMAEWERLRAIAGKVPVILGSDDNVARIMEASDAFHGSTTSEILQTAARLTFPADLIEKRRRADAEARRSLEERLRKDPNTSLPTIVQIDPSGERRELSREEVLAQMLEPTREPEIGAWPATVDPSPGFSVGFDVLTGKPLEKVHIALIPTDDWTTIPAHLHWGGWNENPAPEFHVAALRSWRDRYGAEMVGLSSDVMNLRAQRRPATRDEALSLAREQYVYCNDIVDQGVETLSALGATLMADDWWYFWWD